MGALRAPLEGTGPRPREASVSLNSSCAAGKQRHSAPRPAGGCELARALAPGSAPQRARSARGLLGGGGGGAGRGGAARPRREERASRAGRGAAPGPAPALGGPSSFLQGDEDVPGLRGFFFPPQDDFHSNLIKWLNIANLRISAARRLDLSQVTLGSRSLPLQTAALLPNFLLWKIAQPNAAGVICNSVFLPRCLPRVSSLLLPQDLLSHYLKKIFFWSSPSPFMIFPSLAFPQTSDGGAGSSRGRGWRARSREWRARVGGLRGATWGQLGVACAGLGSRGGLSAPGRRNRGTPRLQTSEGGRLGGDGALGWVAGERPNIIAFLPTPPPLFGFLSFSFPVLLSFFLFSSPAPFCFLPSLFFSPHFLFSSPS